MKVELPLHLSSATATVLTLLIFIYCITKFTVWRTNMRSSSRLPQPSGSWPVIGHLRLLKGLPHIALGRLAEKYGPIFMLKLGVHRVLVVSTPEMAKECLGTNDKVFVNRPHTVFVDYLGFDSAMLGFSPYGKYWREMRKISIVELLSNSRVDMLKHVRISEIRSAMKAIYDCYVKRKSGGDCGGVSVGMKEWFNDLNLNASVRLIAGKTLKEFYKGEEYNKCRKVLMNFFELAGVYVLADALPYLRWLDIGGYEKAMKKAAKEIDHVAQCWLDEHKRSRISRKARDEQDFMDVMLDIFETGEAKPADFDADTTIKATSMAMILGGTNTVAVTLTWILALMLNNKKALERAQDELDTVVGKERLVNETDLKNLHFLQAILKESMRLYPAAPLSIPREAVTDCTVRSYHIPARTRLFVNVHKIHRDPEVWPDPLEFFPERFLTTHKEYDVRGQDFGYMPFRSGKRICPGISFALQVMHITLANLLHGFDISTPSNEAIDMKEEVGLTNHKATPLTVILKPRLSYSFYNNAALFAQ